MAEMKAQRDAYGEVLVELGEKYENFFVLDADLTKSTKTANFQKAFPERHINCGIAEGNMMTVAAGIASCGNVVFASTFAMFAAGRAYEQIRNSIAYPKNNVKVVATHAGLTVGEDGATHQCLEDIALMRAVPGMIVLAPSDAVQTKAACRFAAEYDGPVYIRLGRLPIPVVYKEEDYKFILGKSERLADGNDVTLMFCGPFYELACDVKAILEKNDITARIVDMPSIKPLDVVAVRDAIEDTGLIVTIEDHNVYGGLGSAVSDTLAELSIRRNRGKEVIKIGAQDKFGTSGTPAEILKAYGFDAVEIAKKIVKEKCPEFTKELKLEL
ncbi:MAG: transketolase family protein [Clostridia bacterium]|nr:transketolase family protein [Clostridia bacterium]